MTFILLLGLMPITILPVFAEETPLRALTVGETAIADAAQEQSGEGWSYDGNGTLTLNDATIQSGITATGDLSIVLFGTNKVTISSNGSAINSSNKLTLSGSGSLEAEALGYGSGIFAQDLEIKDCTVIAKGTFGINANNTLTIDNSVLTLAGNSGQGASASNVIIKDGSDVTTTGNYGINALRDLTVDSSEITATGTIYGISAFGIDIKGSKVTSTGNGFHGIFVTRDATIFNSEVTATGKDGSGISSSGLEIKGGSKVHATGSTNGISLTSPLIVEDSELNATGTNIGINGSRKMELKNSKVNATCEGTFALWVTGPLTIDNCEVVASGQGGINASGITITDSSVSATGSSDYGISNPSYVVNLVRSDLTAKGATYGIHAGTVEVADDSTLTAAGATSGLYYAKLKTEFTVLESSSTDGSDPTWGTDYSEGATTSAKFLFVTPSTVRCGIGTDDEAPASYSDPCTFAEAMAAANEAGGGTFYMQLISDTVCGTAPIFTGPQPAILDLNGYVLDLNGKNITLAAGADLTITDSDSQKPHCFDSSTAPWIPIDNSSENTETVRGGVITGGIATHGGAIYVSNDAFLTLQGGNIAGNKAEENGGAVNNQGTCRMTGGSIAGNTAGEEGDGLYNPGSFEITGGSIDDTIADKIDNGSTFKTKVTLNLGDGSGSTASVTATRGQAMPAVTDGGEAIPAPSREGYIFEGYEDADGTLYYDDEGSSIADWDKLKVTALYARFTPLRLTGTVNVSGKAVRGKTLTASVSGSNNTGAFAYQWLRDGAAISGETASSYTLGTDDVGCSISCQVTSTEQPGSITSEALTVADKRTPSSDPEEETVTAGGKTDEKVSANEDPCEAFTDVNRDLWYHGAIDYALVSGIMEGFSKTCFGPDNTLTRAQLVTMLWRHAGEPVVNYAMDFSDIPAEGWYTEAVRWAASIGITDGYGNGTFGANDSITREQLAVFIYRYEQKVNGGGFKGAWMFDLQFSDKDQLSDWAGEAMCWCVMNGVLEGKGSGILDPKGTATRAQAAQMLMNYLGK